MKKIYVAGHKGMVGSSILRLLKKKNYNVLVKDKKYLDLTDQNSVINFFKSEKIDQVYLAAAKVGGIWSNNIYPADFIYQNLMIQTNVIHGAFVGGVKKLLFLGSSCIYPKNSTIPISESKLLTGLLERTNEPYAVAKIAGIKMCESYNKQYGKSHSIDYRAIMPTNLYGPGDKYDLENSHVIPALLRKFHEAKKRNLPKVTVWGTGKPKREFLHVDDLARASLRIMNINKKIFYKNGNNSCCYVNVGTGLEITIKELANKIKEITNYTGVIKFDKSKPDGVKSKLLNSSRIYQLGWKPKVSLILGLKKTYYCYKKIL
jgi:GDP-L-fucose synthase